MNTITDAFYAKMPTTEQLLSMIESCNSSIKTSQEAEEYRMNNYYNCVDDYSWGGPCSKAADENINKCRSRIRIYEEQMKSGSITDSETMEVLCDMDGNIVSDKVIDGKYGMSWVLKSGGYVSVSKKEATYNKKGYKTMAVIYTYEYYLIGGETQKGNNKCVSRLLKSELVAKTNDDACWGMSWYLWCALNAAA